LKNVATGQFLTDSGASASPVTMSDSDEAQNTHWTFIESGAFFNIESETFGIIRGPGASFEAGPYVVVSTSKAAPAADGDKVWTIHYNQSDDTYRYESGNSGRFLYQEENGTVTHSVVDDTDNRSKWKAIVKNDVLSVPDSKFLQNSIKVYPNPAKESFIIELNNFSSSKVEIYNLLGELVFTKKDTKKKIQINNQNRFQRGIYLVKVTSEDNNVYSTKLVIK
jgi:hypothetical protein